MTSKTQEKWEKRFEDLWKKSIYDYLYAEDRFDLDLRESVVKDEFKAFIAKELENERKRLGEQIKEIAWDCLYGEEWVELAEPQNFEAGKLNCSLFEQRVDKLLEKSQ